MTNLITLLFINISAIFVSLFGVFLSLYEPDTAKKIKKHIFAMSSILLCYAVFFDLIPLSLSARHFTVPFFAFLLILTVAVFYFMDFFRTKISKLKLIQSAAKVYFPTTVFFTAGIFSVFGMAIGVAYAANIGTGILVATAISAVALLKMISTSEDLLSTKISKSKTVKSLALAAVSLIPFSLVFYFFSYYLRPLGSLLLVFTTGGLASLAIFAARRFFSHYDIKIKPKKAK